MATRSGLLKNGVQAGQRAMVSPHPARFEMQVADPVPTEIRRKLQTDGSRTDYRHRGISAILLILRYRSRHYQPPRIDIPAFPAEPGGGL
jgi:hypothetical protein